jgi:hypothetical protein
MVISSEDATLILSEVSRVAAKRWMFSREIAEDSMSASSETVDSK